MVFHYDCINCIISQIIKSFSIVEVTKETQEKIVRQVLDFVSHTDYSKCNPEIMGEVWKIFTTETGQRDPYKGIKSYYNQAVLSLENEILEMIEKADKPFEMALKVAITGNLIDFAARHTFDLDLFKQKIRALESSSLAIDHSQKLYDELRGAKTLLYLGDNCGEIALDKLFILKLQELFPHLSITYVTRGQEVINDITVFDAKEVGLDQIVEVIDNGDSSLGTVLDRVSPSFKNRFDHSDVIISKGQGNYESLQGATRGSIFFLFMVKCPIVSDYVGAKESSILCVESS